MKCTWNRKMSLYYGIQASQLLPENVSFEMSYCEKEGLLCVLSLIHVIFVTSSNISRKKLQFLTGFTMSHRAVVATRFLIYIEQISSFFHDWRGQLTFCFTKHIWDTTGRKLVYIFPHEFPISHVFLRAS